MSTWEILLAFIMGFILAVMASALKADDNVIVHDLAHAAAGGMVAVAADSTMDALKEVPWYTRLAVDFASAVLVDEVYEAGTGKSAAVSWTHNGCAGLAGLAVAGVSLHWHFGPGVNP